MSMFERSPPCPPARRHEAGYTAFVWDTLRFTTCVTEASAVEPCDAR